MLLSHILKYTTWTPPKLLNILNGPNPHECPAASCPAISGPVWCLNSRPIRFALFHFSSSAKSQFKIKLFHKLEFHDFVRFKNAAKIIKSALNNAPIRLTFYRHQVGINLKTRFRIFGPCCSNLFKPLVNFRTELQKLKVSFYFEKNQDPSQQGPSSSFSVRREFFREQLRVLCNNLFVTKKWHCDRRSSKEEYLNHDTDHWLV